MKNFILYALVFGLVISAICLVVANHYFWALGCLIIAGTVPSERSDAQRLKK